MHWDLHFIWTGIKGILVYDESSILINSHSVWYDKYCTYKRVTLGNSTYQKPFQTSVSVFIVFSVFSEHRRAPPNINFIRELPCICGEVQTFVVDGFTSCWIVGFPSNTVFFFILILFVVHFKTQTSPGQFLIITPPYQGEVALVKRTHK